MAIQEHIAHLPIIHIDEACSVCDFTTHQVHQGISCYHHHGEGHTSDKPGLLAIRVVEGQSEPSIWQIERNPGRFFLNLRKQDHAVTYSWSEKCTKSITNLASLPSRIALCPIICSSMFPIICLQTRITHRARPASIMKKPKTTRFAFTSTVISPPGNVSQARFGRFPGFIWLFDRIPTMMYHSPTTSLALSKSVGDIPITHPWLKVLQSHC